MPPEILYHNREVSEYDLTPTEEKKAIAICLIAIAVCLAWLLAVGLSLAMIWTVYDAFFNY